MKQYQTLTVRKTILFFSIALATLIINTACASIDTRAGKSTGQIFLYGEWHGLPRMYEKQLEIWGEYYHNQNMRHLFIEYPFFTAEFLNRWMQSDNDDILYELFDDWAGTLVHNPYTLMFYRTIKRDFPKTIFHGVDVGHQYYSTGKRFLQYLRDNNMQDTERYLLTLEAIEQGKNHRRSSGHGFRVTAMTENFIRAFDRLGDQNIMGTFGIAHTSLGFYSYSVTRLLDVPTLAERLRERYGDSVHTTNIAHLLGPIRTDIITINGVDYEASYFDTIFLGDDNFSWVSFWRLENAYDDFSGKPANENFFLVIQIPMRVEMNQVFIIDVARDAARTSCSCASCSCPVSAETFPLDAGRHFFRFSGDYRQGMPVVTGFDLD